MKKSWKRFWIICGTLFGVGVVLTILGFSFGADWNTVAASTPDWLNLGKEVSLNVEKEYAEEEMYGTAGEQAKQYDGIREIEVEASVMNLEVKVDSTLKNAVRVEIDDAAYASKLNQYRDGNTLVLRTNRKLTSEEEEGTVWIYIPEELLDEVELELGAGRVQMERIYARTLNLTMGAGEAYVSDFKVNEADFDCGAGKIEAYGAVEQEIEIDCGIGSIDLSLDGAKEDYNYEVSCGTGKIAVGGESYTGVNEKEYHSHHAKKEMSLDCGIGAINVQFVK